MEVILTQNLPKLGNIGAVVKVKDGYARNYLLPRKLAYAATQDNLRRIRQLEEKRQTQFEKDKKQAEDLAEKLAKVSCTVNVEVNDLEKLYGSISDADIVNALKVEGYVVDKKDIIIEQPIEELGIFEIGVRLHPEVTTNIRLWVTKK